MHECLKLREIQQEIFKFNVLERADCARLSRTCKDFYEQAMDRTWVSVFGWLPFVRCMSPATLLETLSEKNTFLLVSASIPYQCMVCIIV